MKININGIETDFDEPTISYDDVAAFVAIEEQWHPPLPVLSVWYQWQGDGDMTRQGILVSGKPIRVSPGMAFRAERTDAA